MKKISICLLALLVFLSAAGLAAKKPSKTPETITKEKAIDQRAQEKLWPVSKFGYGLTNTSYSIVGLLQVDKVIPSVKYYLNDRANGEFGLSLANNSTDGSATELGLLVRGNWVLSASGATKTLMGFSATYINNVQCVSGATSLNLAYTAGVETRLAPEIILGAYIVPISYSSGSFAGATANNWNIFNNAIISAHYYM